MFVRYQTNVSTYYCGKFFRTILDVSDDNDDKNRILFNWMYSNNYSSKRVYDLLLI